MKRWTPTGLNPPQSIKLETHHGWNWWSLSQGDTYLPAFLLLFLSAALMLSEFERVRRGWGQLAEGCGILRCDWCSDQNMWSSESKDVFVHNQRHKNQMASDKRLLQFCFILKVLTGSDGNGCVWLDGGGPSLFDAEEEETAVLLHLPPPLILQKLMLEDDDFTANHLTLQPPGENTPLPFVFPTFHPVLHLN